jgi:hypothetical protein
MREVASVNTVPGADEAVIVFVRPTGAYPGYQWAVFEVEDRKPATLVGLLGAMKKVAHRAAPGRHVFMAISLTSLGNTADFMTANLDAGKLYYALLMEQEGRWLQPVRANEHAQLSERLAQTGWVEKTDDSLNWARENSEEIEATRFRDYGIWRRKPSFERLALFPDDGN